MSGISVVSVGDKYMGYRNLNSVKLKCGTRQKCLRSEITCEHY